MRVSQVKGYSVSQLDEDFRSKISPSLRALYERVWDEADYVVPPAENGAFFVTTNIVITPNQTLGNCPEVGDDDQVMDVYSAKCPSGGWRVKLFLRILGDIREN